MNITHHQLDRIQDNIHEFVTRQFAADKGQSQSMAAAFRKLNALGGYGLPYDHEVLGLGCTPYLRHQIQREILDQTRA